MATYKVKAVLIHDGKEYKPGDEVELTDKAVIESLFQGAVIDDLVKREPKAEAKPNSKPPAKDDGK